MTAPEPRTGGEELLLARISAAAGRARIGKRRATYAATARTVPARTAPSRGAGGALAYPWHLCRIWYDRCARYVRWPAATAGTVARLDLYERGMTVTVHDRIHVVRYESAAVFQEVTRHRDDPARFTTAYTLTALGGECIVLRSTSERGGGTAAWGPELQRAVAQARLPRALAALRDGERLAFGDFRLSAEEIVCGKAAARWELVERTAIRNGRVEVHVGGAGPLLACDVSGVPNLFLFWTLVERLRPGDGDA
ncbi:hypothetical protein GCM10010218_37180 [Streptomyces mashuensis]|uniref:Uncharacterized protein n=1 Tax=Streptomyces mashuensis TaxID=33904 RepID=A0A919B5N9_9ACTN|nr:DUF6585 family protein [Streptomyces mashuensis]GHF52298.1 hypothetical protein GCM10010218_37180 [Streptomyces mashuensis]